ncbi:MAG: hypothetical protein JJU03_09820 [Idiomarina sp.]|nr:hypothetical protein [Idiomarina sp.]
MKLLRYSVICLLGTLILTACLGSSTPPEQSPPPLPPIVGDTIRYNHLGLDSVAVEALYHAGGSVWAAGDGEIYVSRNINARNPDEANWQIQLDGALFTHLSGFDEQVLFALGLVVGATASENAVELYRSQDSGENWEIIKHNFGAAEDGHHSVLEALFPDSATGYLYGVGQDLLAISYDQGETWETLFGQPGMTSRNFSLALQETRNDLWWGGQNAIEQLSLQRFSLNHGTHQSWGELFPSPSTIEHIAFDRTNTDRVFIGTEGGVGLSENYGEDWQQVVFHDDYAFYMAIAQSFAEPDVWYSARWEKGRQHHPLVFEYSKDAGYTWQQSRHPATQEHFGMRDMVLLATQQDSQDVLWLAMQNGQWEGGGVMRISVALESFN